MRNITRLLPRSKVGQCQRELPRSYSVVIEEAVSSRGDNTLPVYLGWLVAQEVTRTSKHLTRSYTDSDSLIGLQRQDS
jgi:hypothetical protein